MIALDRLLDGLDVTVDPVVLHDVRQRSADRPRAAAITVRFPASGGGIIELAGGATVRLTASSLSVLPPPARARTNGETARSAPRRKGAAADADLMVATGRIRATYLGSVGVFDQLREPMVETLRAGDPMGRCFGQLMAEIAGQRPGRRAMMELLLREGLILFLRRACRRDARVSWMGALEDAGLGRAVAAMRDRPEHAFTLQRLAEVAGMSRSVFAARFAESLDSSPMEFLKVIRLSRAAALLTRTNLPVKTVAARVGYSSRSSFTRAFLSTHRIGPTAFRAEGREPPSPDMAISLATKIGDHRPERRSGHDRRRAGHLRARPVAP